MSNFNVDNNEYTYEHKLKYSDLWRYSTDKLSLSYCISEFIDNSISSCEQTFWDKKQEHELKIDINYYKNDDRYEIIDNAGGMTKQELNDGMIFGNRKYSRWDNTHKNQYGVGMKTAIFWIGKDAEIYTKKDGVEWCGKYLATNKNSEDPVIHTITMSDGSNIEGNSGTKIIIYGSNGGNRTMTENAFNYVNFFLGNRYSKYLNDNRSNEIFKCTININSKNGRKNIGGKVKKITISNSNVKVYRYIENITCYKSKDEIEQLIENKIKTDNKITNIKNNKFYDEFMYKLLNGKELIFDDILTIPSYKNKNIKYEAPIKVYILERGDKHSAGVGIIHSNRYIFHPVLFDKERKDQLAGLYIPFDLKNYEDRGKWIRVDLDISKIQSNEHCEKILPEKNKTQLLFDPDCDIVEDDGGYGSSFKGALRSVFFRWVPFITLMREISCVDTNKLKSDNYENKKIGVFSRDGKVEIDLKIPSKKDNDSTLKEYYNTEKNIKVIVEIIKSPNEYLSIENKEVNIDSETGITIYKYVYNANNRYFSNLKKANDMSYILKLLLYLDIYYNQNDFKDKKVSEVINDALKFWNDEE